jgi:hypothetical protein
MSTIELDNRVKWGVLIPKEAPAAGPNERCIELRLGIEAVSVGQPGWVLDAGCAMNGTVHQLGPMACDVLHFTQNIASEKVWLSPKVPQSYVSGDIRYMPLFGAQVFSRTVCISTLEHVGLDNAQYNGTSEQRPGSAGKALKELCRVTRDTLLITVPYAEPPLGNDRWRFVGMEELLHMRRVMSDCGFKVSCRYYGKTDGGWYGGDVLPVDADESGFPDSVNAIACLRGVR